MSILLTGVGNKPVSLDAGDYFIRDQYQYSLASGLTSTTNQDDGSSGDTTTGDKNPSGVGSGTERNMTFFKVFASAVTFDTVKFVPGYTLSFSFNIEYSLDFSTWTPLDGAQPATIDGDGSYAAHVGQLTQETTAASAKYFRLSVKDVGASGCQVGNFDLRVFSGVTERTN